MRLMRLISIPLLLIIISSSAYAVGPQIPVNTDFSLTWDSNPASELVTNYGAYVSSDSAVLCDAANAATSGSDTIAPAGTPGPGAETFTFPGTTGFNNAALGQYYAGVRAENAAGWSLCSTAVPFELVSVPLPDAITGLVIVPAPIGLGGPCDVSWNAAANADSYNVFWSTDGGATWTTPVNTTALSGTCGALGIPSTPGPMRVAVEGSNSSGEGPSQEFSTTLVTVPGSPLGLVVQ